MDEAEGDPSVGPLVQFRVTVYNALPATLLHMAEKQGDHEEIEEFRELADDAERGILHLYRNMHLPAVPRRGDMVLANPNFEAVTVREVEWVLDPYNEWRTIVVWLEDIDEDQSAFGVEPMLEKGWRPFIDA